MKNWVEVVALLYTMLDTIRDSGEDTDYYEKQIKEAEVLIAKLGKQAETKEGGNK